MMAVDLPNALIIIGDSFDIDPLDLVDGMVEEAKGDREWIPRMKRESGAREVQVMIDLVDEAIDSSNDLLHLASALSIIAELNDLD